MTSSASTSLWGETMRSLVLALALLSLSSPAWSQGYSSPDMASFARAADIPTPAVATPPCIADAGTVGTGPTVYALANHTHCSKVRKGIVTTDSTGVATVTFTTAFGAGITPVCVANADPPAGTLDVINVQGDGDPTNTQATFRITRTNRSVVALIGLTVLSLPASPGATKFHYACFEP